VRPRSPLYYLTHWYTYRTVVGVVLGIGTALLVYLTFWAGTFPIHPEDTLFPSSEPPDPNVVVVGIDDKSIEAVGRFPFSRDRYATVLDNLHQAGAAVTALDVQFSEPSILNQDNTLATAIGKDGPVILAYGQTDLDYGSNHDVVYKNQGSTNRPLDKFLCGDPNAKPGCTPVAELGSTTIIQDSDHVVRRMPMFSQVPCVITDSQGNCQAGVINPVSFLAYRQFLLQSQASSVPLQYSADGATFGEAWPKPLPVDEHGLATIFYSGGPGNIQAHGQYLSFSDVYSNNFDRAKVNNKIVLIGIYDATGIHDEQQVPDTGGSNGSSSMFGVEIHANMIQTLNSPNQQEFFRPEPGPAVLFTLLAVGILLGLLLPRLSALYGFAITVGLAVVYYGAWLLVLFHSLQVVPDFFHTWLAIGLTYASQMAYRFLYEEREKRKVKSLFGQYLKPELVENMAKARSVEDIQVGGERRELSLLFVDIRGFTHMSESMEPQDVLKVIDHYLEELTKIVFKWDGTLDKYVGDEIMAFWNAPHSQQDHALLAVRCAWDMVSKMPEIQATLAAQGLPQIQYGIGVNTGPASIGIMGSRLRRAYTAIGDTVNTAARFCGAAGPTQILIGQKTYEECKDYVAVDMVPGVQLKGKSAEKFTIYRVTAIREAPGQPWATVPGLETYSEVGVYHQQTMIGAGATLAVETGGPTATAEQTLPPPEPAEPAAPVG
jgi:adenylate cyclase